MPKEAWNTDPDISITPEQWIRPYKYDYEGIPYNGRNLTTDDIMADLTIYNTRVLNMQAGNDTYTYPRLKGTQFEDPTVRAMHFYSQYSLPTYRIDFPNPLYYKIIIKINPCLGRTNQQCCDGKNQDVCGDHPSISSGQGIPIAWFMTGYVVQCSPLFDATGNCGTYMEIHEPNNETILEQAQITKSISNGFTMQFISTANLCAGMYELWMVVRTRNGSILQHVKPFYSEYPSC